MPYIVVCSLQYLYFYIHIEKYIYIYLSFPFSVQRIPLKTGRGSAGNAAIFSLYL